MGFLNHEKDEQTAPCHICTGCGRCGKVRGMRVLTESRSEGEKLTLESVGRERLVTADIGTTTIALLLYGRDGTVTADHVCINPQIKYGADVLSRIRAAENREKREDMRLAVLGEIEAALQGFERYLEDGEHMRMVMAGNTTMVYLLLGYDPAELGRAPFHASRLEAAQLEVKGVPCHIFPGQSAFVGGDITAGIYACGLHEREELTLLIDLGTNGEMVLGNRERMIACATAAGPAFEGGVNRGIWGADMVSLLARLLDEGVMDSTGLLADDYFDNGVRISDVRVTQDSIRAVQLAKAAIAAGIRILAEEYGAGSFEKIDRVVLAGGFGYYLKPAAAVRIGLLPGMIEERTVAGGNTALRGCLLLGRKALQAADPPQTAELFAGMEAHGAWNLSVLNLASHPDFEKWYVNAMNFNEFLW